MSPVSGVSTHSRPKAAGSFGAGGYAGFLCFNTQPPEGGWHCTIKLGRLNSWFQHTAARRRLEETTAKKPSKKGFQHTAARRRLAKICSLVKSVISFNTQPPEGGWLCELRKGGFLCLFQHTAARRRLARGSKFVLRSLNGFNTQPPEGGWLPPRFETGCKGWFQHTAARRRLAI